MKTLRIRKTDQGFICEYKKRKLLFFSEWKPYVTYNGSTEPFPYKTATNCLNNLQNYLRPDEFINLKICPRYLIENKK